MTRRTLIAATLFLFGGALALAGNTVVSLRTAHDLPAAEMEGFFPAAAWKLIYDAPINGYVVMRGSVGRDHHVTITTCVDSFPDRSRDALAKQFADRVRIVAPSVGSHLAPSADVFVLFYESAELSQQAVVFGRPHASTMSRSSSGPRDRRVADEDKYLEVIDYRKKPAAQSAEPAVPAVPAKGTSGPALDGAGQP